MALWFAALLGLIQGLTEFIPVSSTAHLRVAPALLGETDPGASYSAVIQLGTLLAVLVYFRKDLLALAMGSIGNAAPAEVKQSRLLLRNLLIATVPIVIAGFALRSHISGPLRSLWVIVATLAGVGLIMGWVDHPSVKRTAQRACTELGMGAALAIGIAQSCALVPGVSRSGATLCMGLVVGLARSEAARFSFLLSIPAIGGAGVLEFRKALSESGGAGNQAWLELGVGAGVAAVSGYVVIAWLIRWLGNHRLTSFAYYRVALAGTLAILIATTTIAP